MVVAATLSSGRVAECMSRPPTPAVLSQQVSHWRCLEGAGWEGSSRGWIAGWTTETWRSGSPWGRWPWGRGGSGCLSVGAMEESKSEGSNNVNNNSSGGRSGANQDDSKRRATATTTAATVQTAASASARAAV